MIAFSYESVFVFFKGLDLVFGNIVLVKCFFLLNIGKVVNDIQFDVKLQILVINLLPLIKIVFLNVLLLLL
jgi:hypothetical protein